MKTKMLIPLIAAPFLFGCADKIFAQATAAAPARPATALVLEETAERVAKTARAQAAIADKTAAMANRLWSRDSAYSDSIPPVVVNFSPVDSKAAEEMEEDLTIFGHLIDKGMNANLGADAPDSALGIEMLYTGGGRSIRGMYVEGSGALFMIKVGFPLMGPVPAEEKQKEKPTNSEWDKAREELLGRSRGLTEGPVSIGKEFDPKQVDALEKVLVGVMKNGSNIRHLKADESVSIAVFGYPAPIRGHSSKGEPKASGGGGANAYARASSSAGGYGSITWSSSSSSQKGTVLTLKARKSDIEDFAKGKIDLEQFTKKVTATRYAGSGHAVTSVNSWVQDAPSIRYQAR